MLSKTVVGIFFITMKTTFLIKVLIANKLLTNYKFSNKEREDTSKEEKP